MAICHGLPSQNNSNLGKSQVFMITWEESRQTSLGRSICEDDRYNRVTPTSAVNRTAFPILHRQTTYQSADRSPFFLMKTKASAITQILKQKGLRVTPQRFAVFENLLHRSDHPTAEEILADLNRDRPLSSTATVYSALQALQKVGLVKEVLLQPGVSRFDANTSLHHHFRCDCCGAISDLPWETFAPLELNSLPVGLRGDRYEIAVRGSCRSCRMADD
jgi:Fur family transcriptional regulator, peroxide stress response regulator